MSADNSSDGQGGAGRREVAYRLFATEFDDSTVSHSDSDEERAPNYVITPTGARVNRLFVVGVLTEVESVSDDVLRARVVDPTGAFVIYAGQYQPDPMTFLERADPPSFVAVTGKARTYQPEDSDRIFTSIRPESINEVDSETRDRWTVQTAEQTINRIELFLESQERPETGSDLEAALAAEGIDAGLAAGIPLAMDHYRTTDAYLAALREIVIDAVRVVANEREEVPPLELSPDEAGTESVEIETGTAEAVSEQTATGTSATAESQPASEPEPSAVDEPTTADTATQSSETTTPEQEIEPSATMTESETPSETSTGASTTESSEIAEETGSVESDDLGDFDDFDDADTGLETEPATEETGDTDVDAEADLDVASDEMYEFDEEEREEIEEEYGTEFSTGTEVGEPGEADIETSAPEATESDLDDSPETDGEPDSEPIDASEKSTGTAEDTAQMDEATITQPTDDESEDDTDHETEAEAEPAGEPEDAVDLDETVIDVMSELDDGDGADREELIETVTDRHGVNADAVEDAIQDALMSGQCYEPDEGRLKAI